MNDYLHFQIENIILPKRNVKNMHFQIGDIILSMETVQILEVISSIMYNIPRHSKKREAFTACIPLKK